MRPNHETGRTGRAALPGPAGPLPCGAPGCPWAYAYESQPARAARTPASKRLRASSRAMRLDTVRRTVRNDTPSFLLMNS